MKMRGAVNLLLALALALPIRTSSEEAPDLPQVQGELPEAPPADFGTAEIDVPGDDPSVPKAALKVRHAKPARFRLSNFLIGALGGAVFGGGIAVLFFARKDSDGSLDLEKMKLAAPLGAASGAALGGLLGLLLGATTPTGPTPPEEMQGRPPMSDLHAALKFSF